MKTKKGLKNVLKAIKKWDKKNSTMDDRIYMLLFLTASVIFMFNLSLAVSDLAAM